MSQYGFKFFPRRIFMRPWRSSVSAPFLIAAGIGSLIITFGGGPCLGTYTGMVKGLIIGTAVAVLYFCGSMALSPPRGGTFAKIGFRRVGLKELCLSVASLPVILAGSALLTGCTEQILDFFQISYAKEQDLLLLVRQSDCFTFLQLLLLTAGVIPVLEELVFRRALYALLLKLGAPAAMIGTALIFSAAHGFLVGAPGLFFIGLVFQVLCNMTRNLWCSVISHGLLNATVLTISFAAGKYGWL